MKLASVKAAVRAAQDQRAALIEVGHALAGHDSCTTMHAAAVGLALEALAVRASCNSSPVSTVAAEQLQPSRAACLPRRSCRSCSCCSAPWRRARPVGVVTMIDLRIDASAADAPERPWRRWTYRRRRCPCAGATALVAVMPVPASPSAGREARCPRAAWPSRRAAPAAVRLACRAHRRAGPAAADRAA